MRSGLRATGLVKPVRKTLGRAAARLVFRLSTKGGTPTVVRGHRMILALKGEYPAPDMVADRYEPETTRLFQTLLRPGQTVVGIEGEGWEVERATTRIPAGVQSEQRALLLGRLTGNTPIVWPWGTPCC